MTRGKRRGPPRHGPEGGRPHDRALAHGRARSGGASPGASLHPNAALPAATPARVPVPALPREPLTPRPGSWLWTCRAGFEAHLFEELAWLGARPRLLGPALVEAGRAVRGPPAFGRMGFEVAEVVEGPVSEVNPERLCAALTRIAGGRALEVQAWTPDTDQANAQTALADSLCGGVRALLAPQGPALVLGQLCVLGPSLLALGVVAVSEAVSRAPGGRNRMRREADAPSRAAMKLEEALDGYGLSPSRGESCVDLGAAPGGWTARLVARGARVIAVDPANLTPELTRNPRVRHVKESAFAFEPDEPVDWLLCDMAWRPLEVAQLLAKWGRRGWALHLVANIKLPMKDKNPILHRVRATLESGWGNVRVRQLYHDRDEVTVTARRGG